MAATFEGKSKAEFFGGAAARQKRSNAYASYTPAAPTPAPPKREEGKTLVVNHASPVKKPDAPKPAPVAVKPAPKVEAKPTAFTGPPEPTYKQAAAPKEDLKRKQERERKAEIARRDIEASRSPVSRAIERGAKAGHDAAYTGISKLVDYYRSYASPLTKFSRYLRGDPEKAAMQKRRLAKLESSK